MSQPNRRQISLRTAVWERASRLRDERAAASGRKVTISDTIDQGLGCLEDATSRGAWLSPKEAAPVLEDRLRKDLVSAIAQFIARTMPDRELRGVTFEIPSPGAGVVLNVHLDDRAVPLFLGGEAGWSAEHSTSTVGRVFTPTWDDAIRAREELSMRGYADGADD